MEEQVRKRSICLTKETDGGASEQAQYVSNIRGCIQNFPD